MKLSLTSSLLLALSLISAGYTNAISATKSAIQETSQLVDQPSPAATAYFEQAFAFIKHNAYFHKHLDFNKVKQQALAKMDRAQSPADTHEAIHFVIKQLNDRHSFFQPASPSPGRPADTAKPANAQMPLETSVEGRYGIIKLKSYNSTDAANSHRIADSLYTCLVDFDKKHVKGTIIDLREMEGGTYIPFVTGLAPLLDAEHLIGFIDRNGKKGRTIRYQNGIYYQQGRKKSRLGYLSRYERPGVADLPIAVLTGRYTASSGEMILLSLKGLPQVRTFGAATYGVPTGKANFFLPDGSMISLTNTVCFDRNKKLHSGPIEPDLVCGEREAVQMAKEWIDGK